MTDTPEAANMSPLPAALFHYTNLAGLRGILQSQRLFAFHFADLNDRTEIRHFQSVLERAVSKCARRKLLKLSPTFTWTSNTSSPADPVTQNLRNLIDSTHEAAFSGNAHFHEVFPPFITSFCGHSDDEPYEQANGLLSQWRGYGHATDGRFALVFDSRELHQRIQTEYDQFEYSLIDLNPVAYEDTSELFDDTFSSVIGYFSDALVELTMGNNQISDTAALDTLTANVGHYVLSSTYFKHRSFREEREVRIVACPMKKENRSKVAEYARNNGQQLKPTKPVKLLKERRYIELFSRGGMPLPIKKIIVGPSRLQSEQFKLAKELAGRRGIEVTASETPLID